MPLYEYQCQDCGKIVEIIQKFSDQPLKTCSGCGGTVDRLLSAPAIQFKGAGWYVTDYAKSKNGGGSGAESNGKAKPAESSTNTTTKSEKSEKSENKS